MQTCTSLQTCTLEWQSSYVLCYVKWQPSRELSKLFIFVYLFMSPGFYTSLSNSIKNSPHSLDDTEMIIS